MTWCKKSVLFRLLIRYMTVGHVRGNSGGSRIFLRRGWTTKEWHNWLMMMTFRGQLVSQWNDDEQQDLCRKSYTYGAVKVFKPVWFLLSFVLVNGNEYETMKIKINLFEHFEPNIILADSVHLVVFSDWYWECQHCEPLAFNAVTTLPLAY